MSNATSTVRRRLPGRPRAKTSVGAREALLSAVELFAQQGVAATRFAMIAERAALTPAMLHYYFEDRERLLDAVVQERMAPAITTVWAPVTAGRPATVLIRGVVERLLDGVERTPWIPSTWIRDVAPAWIPQTHLMWRDVAPILAKEFTVVCADLRGYGSSGCPGFSWRSASRSCRCLRRGGSQSPPSASRPPAVRRARHQHRLRRRLDWCCSLGPGGFGDITAPVIARSTT
jgi:AcrR family transcriptional regulator